jgi:beta-lactamase class A
MNRIARALSLTLALAATPLTAQRAAPADPPAHADRALQTQLESLVRGFHGNVGIYVRNLRTGATAEIDADSVFPTASMIKVPILLTLYDQAERGAVHLDSLVAFPDTLHYRYGEASDVVGYMAFLMLTISDNFAALWLQGMVGGGATVNEWLAAHGFRDTRVNSRTPGREQPRSVYGWGQTTPREIANALVMIRQGRAVSPRASEEMYRLLTNSFWKNAAL